MSDFGVIGLELAVVAGGLALLLLDLWCAPESRRHLGYVALAVVGVVLVASFAVSLPGPRLAFGGSYVLDEFALFFKRLFLAAGLVVLGMAVPYSNRFDSGRTEYPALMLFALAGMMLAASANDFTLLFVSLELITVTFYVLTSFHRRQLRSLEAGVKYLILGALSSAFLVYGIALVFGTAGTLNFTMLAAAPKAVLHSKLLLLGLVFILVGLGFKIAAVPFQIWAPDVYQGAPTPTTALLAFGSKAAGFVLLFRVLFVAVPSVTADSGLLLAGLSAASILYGGLCAIPQRNLKRLMGYSSIANAGYLLLGFAAGTAEGTAAVLYFLAGYLFTVLAGFAVLSVVLPPSENDDLEVLAGLHQRSPLLAGSLACSMVSLAGVPPLAGFFGKFLLFKAVLARAAQQPHLYVLIAIALVGVVMSLYYYFGVIRAIYWDAGQGPTQPIELPQPVRWVLYATVAGMLWLGIFPNSVLNLAQYAAVALTP